MYKKYLILLVLLVLVTETGFSQYFLETTRYTTDGGNTFIQKHTRFEIDVNKMILKKIQDGVTMTYRITQYNDEPDETISDGIRSAISFICYSNSGERCIFMIITVKSSNKPTVFSMGYVNYSTNEKEAYLK